MISDRTLIMFKKSPAVSVDQRQFSRIKCKVRQGYEFPIPAVNELLDTLDDATYSTKLDLTPEDIDKKPSDHSHDEYLVTLFGLSNAPSTFQSLMNTCLESNYGI